MALTEEARRELLQSSGVGKLPTPIQIKEELESEWLRPSLGGKKELSGVQWAMFVSLSSSPCALTDDVNIVNKGTGIDL